MKKGVKFSLVFLSLIFVLSLSGVSASSNDTWQDFCETQNQLVCERIVQQIPGAINYYSYGHDLRLTIYNQSLVRIENVINRYRANNFSLTSVDASLQDLKNKLNKFNSDYSIVIAKLHAIENFSCSNLTLFLNAANDIQASVSLVRNDSVEILFSFEKLTSELANVSRNINYSALAAAKLNLTLSYANSSSNYSNYSSGRRINISNWPAINQSYEKPQRSYNGTINESRDYNRTINGSKPIANESRYYIQPNRTSYQYSTQIFSYDLARFFRSCSDINMTRFNGTRYQVSEAIRVINNGTAIIIVLANGTNQTHIISNNSKIGVNYHEA